MGVVAGSVVAQQEIDDCLKSKGAWAVLRREKKHIDEPNEERCSCWSDAYGQADSRCELCSGTGFVGGYYESQLIRVHMTEVKSGWGKEDYGTGPEASMKILTHKEPNVAEGDLVFLVEVNVVEEVTSVIEKYVVETSTPVLIDGVMVAQEATIKRVPCPDKAREVGLE